MIDGQSVSVRLRKSPQSPVLKSVTAWSRITVYFDVRKRKPCYRWIICQTCSWGWIILLYPSCKHQKYIPGSSDTQKQLNVELLGLFSTTVGPHYFNLLCFLADTLTTVTQS